MNDTTQTNDSNTLNALADVEKVVRCKDCIHRPYEIPAKYDSFGKCVQYSYITSPDDICPYVCDDPWYNRIPEDNFFCGFGDKKETKLATNLQPTCNQLEN